MTWYGDTLAADRQSFAGESLIRTFSVAGAEIVGPSLSRVFEGELGPFGKFKHVIEPRWTYGYLGDFDDRERFPLFDEVDAPEPANLGSWSLVNRLLAKPPGDEGSAREVLALAIGQFYSFDERRPLQVGSDPDRTDLWGPLTARLRFNPVARTSVQAQVAYGTLFNELQSTSLSGNVGLGTAHVGLTWFTRFNDETGEIRSNQTRLFTGFDVLPGKLRLDAQVNYDIEERLLQQQRYFIHYNAQCYGLRFEMREFRTAERRDRDFRFALTLKNVGTFLDLTGGTSEEPPLR